MIILNKVLAKVLYQIQFNAYQFLPIKPYYTKLFQNAMTSKYKKTDKHKATNINKEGINHAREVNISYRIKISDTVNSFITLKDHKYIQRTF